MKVDKHCAADAHARHNKTQSMALVDALSDKTHNFEDRSFAAEDYSAAKIVSKSNAQLGIYLNKIKATKKKEILSSLDVYRSPTRPMTQGDGTTLAPANASSTFFQSRSGAARASMA